MSVRMEVVGSTVLGLVVGNRTAFPPKCCQRDNTHNFYDKWLIRNVECCTMVTWFTKTPMIVKKKVVGNKSHSHFF